MNRHDYERYQKMENLVYNMAAFLQVGYCLSFLYLNFVYQINAKDLQANV